MYNHAPEGYDCPFCRLVRGLDVGPTGSNQDDLIFRSGEASAFIASHWRLNNPGHVLVVPNEHYENIYDLPPALGAEIQWVAQKIAVAFKAAYGCDGVSSVQHNEPSGNQEVWHYHLHVFPRYMNDELYLQRKRPTTSEERRPFAEKLREHLSNTVD